MATRALEHAMIDERFSAAAFSARGLNTDAARALADELADEVLEEMHKVLLPKFLVIVEKLNAMGHNLRPCGDIKRGDVAFRDDKPVADPYECKLRLAFNCVVSTGYAHLRDSWNDLMPETT